MVYATGNEAMAAQKEADKQFGQDSFRRAALDKIAGTSMATAAREGASVAGQYGLAGAGIGALGSILSALLIFSDERLKTSVSKKEGDKDIREFLDKMNAVNYDMGGKNESGILAQDLEKSKAGREMVKRGPAGLRMVDVGEASKKMLAAMALMKKDNDKLEARLKRLEKGGK